MHEWSFFKKLYKRFAIGIIAALKRIIDRINRTVNLTVHLSERYKKLDFLFLHHSVHITSLLHLIPINI